MTRRYEIQTRVDGGEWETVAREDSPAPARRKGDEYRAALGKSRVRVLILLAPRAATIHHRNCINPSGPASRCICNQDASGLRAIIAACRAKGGAR